MAMMDNAAFLISHIRNSFITSDDTGMCEVILEAEQCTDKHSSAEKRPTTWHGSAGDSTGDNDSDTELSHSYDILADMDFASHRRRSNTAQRLEKIKQEKRKQSKIKHVPWKSVSYNADDTGELFTKKAVDVSGPEPRQKSLLSVQLEQVTTVPTNPFMEYARFDARASSGVPSKKIDIFLTMAAPEDLPYPMSIVTLSTAKVQDLIGLICWQYTVERRLPLLFSERMEAFSLHIAEDDGEVDMDFPALDNKEPISKFGFAKLALVMKKLPKTPQKSGMVANIDMQHRGTYNFPIDNDSMTIKELLAKLLELNGLQQRPGRKYRLEKQDEPGVVVDSGQTLRAVGTLDLCMIRENSARGDQADDVLPHELSEMAESLSSPQYKSFNVNMIHKLRTNREIQLGISGDKIEIDPHSSKGLFKTKSKPVTLDIEDIAMCTMSSESKSHGKSTFRLVYQSTPELFKHYDFECESSMATEIVQKITNILEMRSSPVRKDYKAHKQRKHKKHSISLLN